MHSLIGQPAPHFSAPAVINGELKEDFSLSLFAKQRYVLFFFYPLDFTFVCPTELHAFQEAAEAFNALETTVVACSVDSWHSHAAWARQPRAEGGIADVTFPIVSDIKKTIASDYGVLNPETGFAYRGQFLIDKEGIVRHQLINDLPIGRSVDEALRLIAAWRQYERHGEVCPANWQKNKPTMQPSAEGIRIYFSNAID